MPDPSNAPPDRFEQVQNRVVLDHSKSTIYYKIRLDLELYVKQTQNDNLTSDPPSALLGAGA